MAEFLLPEYVIDKEEPEKGIRDLIKKINPHWNAEEVTIKVLSGGHSSKMYKCCDTNGSKESITVRIRYVADVLNMEGFTTGLETTIIQAISTTGHFPKMKAIFANGYSYEYIPGTPIFNMKVRSGVMTNDILKIVTKEFAYIHNMKPKGVDYTKDMFFDRLETMVVPAEIKLKHETVPTKETLLKEIDFLKEYIQLEDCPITICHGDPHPGNIVWNEKKGIATFVDWENVYTSRFYFDIAQFCCAMEIFENFFKYPDITFPKDWTLKFPKIYFDEWNKIRQKEFDEQEFLSFQKTIEKCQLALWIILIIFPLKYPSLTKTFANDSFKFYDFCRKSYFSLKENLTGKNKFEGDL